MDTKVPFFIQKRLIRRYLSDVLYTKFFCFFCSMKKKKVVAQKPPGQEILKVARRLKELRLRQGYTSYESFANEHGLSRALYGRYEKGKDLRFSSLVKIVRAFDMTLEEFFSEGFD